MERDCDELIAELRLLAREVDNGMDLAFDHPRIFRLLTEAADKLEADKLGAQR